MPSSEPSASRKERRRKRRRQKRVVGVLFEDDGDSISTSTSSVYSLDDGEESDEEIGMTDKTKRYRRAFLAMSTIAIFFALYFPAAVMKGVAGPRRGEAKGSIRKGKRMEESSRRTKSTDKGDDLAHTIERKRKQDENATDHNVSKQNKLREDEDVESEMDFDAFLDLQEERKKQQTEAPAVGAQEQVVSSSQVDSTENAQKPLATAAVWEAMLLQQAQHADESQENHDGPPVVPEVENRFSAYLAAEQHELKVHPPSHLQEPMPELVADHPSEINVKVVGQTNQQPLMVQQQQQQQPVMPQNHISNQQLLLGQFSASNHQQPLMTQNQILNQQPSMIQNQIFNQQQQPLISQNQFINQQPMIPQNQLLNQLPLNINGLEMQPPRSLQLESINRGGQSPPQESARGYSTNGPNHKFDAAWGYLTKPGTVMLSAGFRMSRRLFSSSGHSSLSHRKLQQDLSYGYPQYHEAQVQGQAQHQGYSQHQNGGDIQQNMQAFPEQKQQQSRPDDWRGLQQQQQQMPGYPQPQQQQMQGYPRQQQQILGNPQMQQQEAQGGSQEQQQQQQQQVQENPQQTQIMPNALNNLSQQQIQSSQLENQRIPAQQMNQGPPLVQEHNQQAFQQQTQQSPPQQGISHGGSQESNLPAMSSSGHGGSHVAICQVVLGQREGRIMEEHTSCLDDVDPSRALAQIFLSAYLAHQARIHGYPVEYEHNCGAHRKDKKLIQELLPSPFHIPESNDPGGDMRKEQIHAFCQMIVESAQQKQTSNPLEILLWDTNASTGNRAPVSMLERIEPLALANLYHASMKSRLVKSSLQAGYGVLKGRNTESEHIAVGRAVIYLPCRDRECQDLALVPYMNYLMHLPISVNTVDIVVTPRCMKNLPGCASYVNDLASNVRQFGTQRGVEVIQATPSGPDTFARLIEAEHVLCAPGFGMGCLFPSLGRTQGRVTLFDVGPDQIEGDSASSFVARLPPQMITHVTPPMSTFGVAFLSNFMGQDAALKAFVQHSPARETGDCRFFRGRVGQWTQDMVYAEHAQYRTPLKHYSGNADKLFKKQAANGKHGDMQYRPSTTYRWDEARYDTCGVSQVTQEGVCETLKSMNARRIFILGDSLNLQLAQSMWMWLTNENHGDSPTERGKLDPNFKTTIQCMGYGSYTLQFIRNDEFLENDLPVSIDKEQKNCATYCYPWTREYLADESRTILIANVGAHIHQFEKFQEAMDRFVDVVDGMRRPNDIVLFRTLVPGHWDCSRPGLKPFHKFADYLQDAEEHPNPKDEIYTWSKFNDYNDYAAQKLDNRRFLPMSNGPRALMEVVDVNPMTTLRPDGHCSDEFRPPSYLDTDCLHYSLPGPVDWWSHMAFSHLQDIATAENFLAQQV